LNDLVAKYCQVCAIDQSIVVATLQPVVGVIQLDFHDVRQIEH